MPKPEKIMKKCPLCNGTGKLPDNVTRQLPNPKKNVKCTRCQGKRFVFVPPTK